MTAPSRSCRRRPSTTTTSRTRTPPAFAPTRCPSRAQPVYGPGYASRVNAVAGDAGIDFSSGALESSNRRWTSRQRQGVHCGAGSQRQEAYTRAGDLRMTADGMVVTATGLQVLSETGPVQVPPARRRRSAATGTVVDRPPRLERAAPVAGGPDQAGQARDIRPAKGRGRPVVSSSRAARPRPMKASRELGRARSEQRQRRHVAGQHDRAAAPVRFQIKSINSTDQNEQARAADARQHVNTRGTHDESRIMAAKTGLDAQNTQIR